MPWRWAWLNVSAEGAKICDNFQQEEIPVPEHFTDAIQLVSRGVHFLEVAENVAVVADRAYVAAGLDHRVDKGGISLSNISRPDSRFAMSVHPLQTLGGPERNGAADAAPLPP